MMVASPLSVLGATVDEWFLPSLALVFVPVANKCYILKALKRKWHVLKKMLLCGAVMV